MLIYAVCPAGQERRVGLAAETWEGRTRGGAVQKSHRLALVKGSLLTFLMGNNRCGVGLGGVALFKSLCGEF